MAEISNKRIMQAITLFAMNLIILHTVVRARTIYVDADATNISDGSSWANAYWCLQDALSNAQAGDEIRVACGTYKPDRRVTISRSRRQITASGDRAATFHLINGVDIRGGYAGVGGLDPDARDVNLYKTILSGDLNGDDTPDFSNTSEENSYHVVIGSGTNETSVLDGFTITAGNANGFSDNSGAGMYNDRGSPTVTNCTFTYNSGVNGGGMCNSESSPVLTNCIFNSNLVSNMGGGMFNYGLNSECNPMLINCTFSGNSALNGGGMLNGKQGNAILTNCTFTGNHGYGIICDNSQVTVVNTIIWNNSPFEIYLAGGSITVSYSDVRGGWPGIGNIDADPLFVDANGAYDVSGTEDDNLRLLPDSPCIDAGDNSATPQSVVIDLDGNPRIVNGTIDMGAYEAEAVLIASTYYVDAVNGDDNNNGLTLQSAFATIHKCIDTATDGDVILVYPGLYQEEINFLGKKLTVQGVGISPAGVPVLHNPGDFAVSFYSGETPDSILKNFIIADSFMGVFIADSSPTLTNLTIVGNKYGIEVYADSEPDISNTILWNNTDGDLFGCRARYSCVERGGEGEGNILDDPLFVDPENDDYHIRSKRGRYWPEYDIWVLDKTTSPCVDGGDPNTDPSDEPLPNGGRINIGAYGGTIEASMSPLRLSTKYSGGSGAVEDPYQISTADDLMLLGDSPEDYDKYFILTADIDLDPALSSRKVFDKAVIAPSRNPDMYSPFDGIPFAGTLDGNDHTISNLTIIGASYLGLFGQLSPEARISNIGLEAVDIDGIGISIGGLVGYNNGSITKSYSNGSVRGAYGVGGLASYSDGCITACYSTGTVSGSTDVGGLVGFNASIITCSHCDKTVTGDENVGGLVGFNTSVELGDAIITNSYSTGSVFGRRACIGGLVGRNTSGNITTSYSSSAVSGTSFIGGLVGWNTKGGNITSCFWDVETSGKSISDGGIGKTTTEMQTASNFLDAGWDFIGETENGTDDIWWILEGQDYPRLWWQYGQAFSPYPQNDAVDVPQPLTLSWLPGGLGLYHDVYFGEDRETVANATTESPEIYRGCQEPEVTIYDPGNLNLDKKYYWRIDEVNDGDPNNPWKGHVWSFTTANFIVIDDFESYSAENPLSKHWNGWHYNPWPPGPAPYFAGNGTGAVVGDETTASGCEEVIVHGGSQSMPFTYDNNTTGFAWYSETELTLTTTRDWTEEGVTELSLWFCGRTASVGSFVEEPDGTYTMTGSGIDIGGQYDQFHYAFKTLTGPGTIVAKIESMENTHELAKAGVMVRNRLSSGSQYVFLCVTPNNGVVFQGCGDPVPETSFTINQTDITAPHWVKLERDTVGNFAASHSVNGTNWQPVQNASPMDISMSSSVYIGLAVTAHDANAICQAVFSNVTITGMVGTQWEHQDIGITYNDAEPLYVAVSNAAGLPAVVVHDDPTASQIDTWTEWIIPLSAFADQGIYLKNVDRFAIGLGTMGNMTISGGQGKMYFDDIRLYRPAPEPGEN